MQYPESIDDYGRKYSNSFIVYDGKPIYCNGISEVEEDDSKEAILHYASVKQGNQQCVWDPDLVATLNFRTQFVNAIERPASELIGFRVIKMPRRQWKRGLCPENVEIVCDLLGLAQHIGAHEVKGGDFRLSWNVVKAVFTPWFPTIGESIGMLDEFQSISWSPEYQVMSSSLDKERYLIRSLYGFIGDFHPGSREIRIMHTPSYQEFSDFLVRSNQRSGYSLVTPNAP